MRADRVGVREHGVGGRVVVVHDDAYLARIAATVRTLARHGVLALLDFHQDLYNERFQGEGAPDSAVQDGGLANPKLGFPGNYLANPAVQHAFLEGELARADRFMVPWLEWAYCGCEDPTTTGPGTKQAILIDPSKPPRGSNLVRATLGALV
ncbi:MAG TPA: hypothetical protein VMU39_06395, partial [Solirubrobacteraceae bacterium]|nr:hypothetical protein [Solirubrobacteraceae bacterium]